MQAQQGVAAVAEARPINRQATEQDTRAKGAAVVASAARAGQAPAGRRP